MFFRHSHSDGSEPFRAAREEFGRAWRDRHERHRRGGGFRERDGERVFEHGDLRLVIMALLAEKPRYGYEIIKALEERVGGGYSPSPGVVYPTLTLLEEVGHASVADEHGGRRLYTLSDEGRAFLEANRTVVDAIFARVDGANASRRGPPTSVLRAMENLGLALRSRLKGRALGEEHIRVITAALDAAARAVEES
ncbi:MAG: PadR family transcriptional regulator [Roseiarcus sp.]|jgi:DNA-binding PadR family transcriptional regulator